MESRNSKKRSTAREVARHADVSLTTVSRYLNEPETVTKETQEKVRKAIEDLGFRPSAAGRAINAGRTKIFGALVSTIDNAIFARVLLGVETQLSRNGYSLIVATTGDDRDTELAKVRELIKLGAEGLIVSGITHHPDLVDLVTRSNLPVVAMSYYNPDYVIPTIGYDNYRAAQLVARHLADLGHHKIAVVHAPEENNDRIRNRLLGLREFEPELDFSFFRTELSVAGGRHAASRLIEVRPDATAFLCLSDIIAMGVMFELQSQGLSVPEHASVTGMESIMMAENLATPLTSVRMSTFEMGQQVARGLTNWVENNAPPSALEIPVELVIRASTAPPRANS